MTGTFGFSSLFGINFGWYTFIMVALTIVCDNENITPTDTSVAEVQKRYLLFGFAVRCCNCISSMFLRLHYIFGVSVFTNLSSFISKGSWVCCRPNNTGSLYVHQFNMVVKQIEDKDINVRPVYAQKM